MEFTDTLSEMNQIMKRNILIFALVLVLVTAALSVQGAPRLTLPESEFDFGYVPQNSTISHVFWLMSDGDDSLKILKVVPG